MSEKKIEPNVAVKVDVQKIRIDKKIDTVATLTTEHFEEIGDVKNED